MSVVEVVKALEVSQETIKKVNEEIRVLEKLEDENFVLCRLHKSDPVLSEKYEKIGAQLTSELIPLRIKLRTLVALTRT